MGLAKGGTLENAIVVKNDEILNNNVSRNSKEFVNHKILDCIGDLYTSGYRMIGSVVCPQGGHYLTNKLLRKLFENKENFSIIEIQERYLPHTTINRNLLRSISHKLIFKFLTRLYKIYMFNLKTFLISLIIFLNSCSKEKIKTSVINEKV